MVLVLFSVDWGDDDQGLRMSNLLHDKAAPIPPSQTTINLFFAGEVGRAAVKDEGPQAGEEANAMGETGGPSHQSPGWEERDDEMCPSSSPSPRHKTDRQTDDVELLVGLGCCRADAEKAMRLCGGDVEQAANWILNRRQGEHVANRSAGAESWCDGGAGARLGVPLQSSRGGAAHRSPAAGPGDLAMMDRCSHQKREMEEGGSAGLGRRKTGHGVVSGKGVQGCKPRDTIESFFSRTVSRGPAEGGGGGGGRGGRGSAAGGKGEACGAGSAAEGITAQVRAIGGSPAPAAVCADKVDVLVEMGFAEDAARAALAAAGGSVESSLVRLLQAEDPDSGLNSRRVGVRNGALAQNAASASVKRQKRGQQHQKRGAVGSPRSGPLDAMFFRVDGKKK